jgi:5-hydroxyisourate hydrolase
MSASGSKEHTMAGGISIHVVDVACGVVAAGLQVRVERLEEGGRWLIAEGRVSAGGTVAVLDHLAECPVPGVYEVTFLVGDYYRRESTALPAIPFLDVVPYRFGLADAAQHYHLPFKMTPWGFSLFRGGA